jgi:hypothetical protein
MAGYTRQSSYTDGDIIDAADSNNEFDQIVNVFSNTSGHKHDGTAAEGPVIGLIGDPGVATPKNKVVVDDTNNQIEFSIDVSSTSTEQFVVKDGVIEPTTDSDIDLGSSGKEFKDLYIDGVAYVDSIAMPTTTVTDILDEDTLSSNSATALATQQSIKAYVDTTITAQDLDFQADSGGALNIDLDSETLTLTGGTGIDTSGSSNTVTFAIDSTVATLAGSQSLTNKTIDVDNNTVSNIEVDNLKSGVLDTDLSSVAGTDTTLASAKAIKAYVDAQVTASDLDFQGDSGGALSIDLDSETLDIAGGTGIDTSGSSNTLTVAIDSTVATLTGSQTMTNKSLTAPILTGSASAAGSILFKEDTDNGTNAVTLIGPASTADVTVTLPASAGTVALTSDIPSSGISSGNVATFTSGAADNDFLRIDGTAIEGRSAAEVLSDIGGQASLTFGISNTNAVKIDSSSVADDEYARFTASGLESRSTSEVLSDIGAQASLTFGISNTNAVKVDSSSVADDEYARFTANGLESRSTAEVLSDIGGQASLTFGISNTNAVKIDSSSVADDEYARFTANGLESRSASETRTDIGLGSAAVLTAGTSANNAVQLDGSARLPAVDGSQLTNLPSAGATAGFAVAMAIAL